MSEQPEQTPSKPTASPSAAQTSSSQTNSFNQIIAKVQPIAQKAWVSSRPTIAQALKATSNTLQSAADQLDQQIAAADTTVEPLNIEPLKQAATTFWAKTQPIWAKLIGLMRTRLPEDVSGKLSDRALSGIVAGLALLLLSITTHLPSGKATATPPPVAKPASRPVPVKQPIAPAPTAAKPITQKFPVDTAQGGQPFPTDLSAPSLQPATPPAVVTVPAPTVKPAPTAVPPSALVAPATPTAPKPAPVKLTPEQKLMAKLQADLGDQSDLLTGVKPNKAESRLQISLEPDWYDLPYNQQDRFAQALFDQAQTLRFNSLELLDNQGEVVARSPIVGSEMVILLRQ